MNPGLERLNGVAAAWWEFVVQSSWQAALVGLVLLAVVHLGGRRWPAPLRYALLVVALLKFACPPLLPVPTGIFTRLASPMTRFSPATQERKPAQAAGPWSMACLLEAGAGGLHLAGGGRILGTALLAGLPKISWMGWLMIIHAAGTVTIGTLIFARAARLRRLSEAARRRLEEPLRDHYRDLAIELEVYRIPSLGISDQVEAPMAFGVPRPAIMLPQKILGSFSKRELNAVLAHELAHCRRGDLWLNWVQLALLAIWWFHPLVWMVNRSLREIREDCCDDLLLARRIVSDDDYCEVLLRAAAQLCPSLRLHNGLELTAPLHPLGRRVARIMDRGIKRYESVSWSGAFAVLAVAALVLPGVRTSEAINSNAAGQVRPPAMPNSMLGVAAVSNPIKPPPVASRPDVPITPRAVARNSSGRSKPIARPSQTALAGTGSVNLVSARMAPVNRPKPAASLQPPRPGAVQPTSQSLVTPPVPARVPVGNTSKRVRRAPTPAVLYSSIPASPVRQVRVHYVRGWPPMDAARRAR